MKYIVSKSVVITEEKEESVLLNTKSGKFFGLDKIGTVIWGLIREGHSQDVVVKKILQAYDAPYEIVEKDVNDLLNELKRHGLVILNE